MPLTLFGLVVAVALGVDHDPPRDADLAGESRVDGTVEPGRSAPLRIAPAGAPRSARLRC